MSDEQKDPAYHAKQYVRLGLALQDGLHALQDAVLKVRASDLKAEVEVQLARVNLTQRILSDTLAEINQIMQKLEGREDESK